MKKRIFFILLSCMLFVGCFSNKQSTEETVETTSNIEEFEEEMFVISKPDDEEGTLYFTCRNWNSDIYLGNSVRQQQIFYAISKEPLQLDTISVTLPIETDYAIMASNLVIDEYQMTSYTVTDEYNGSFHLFPLYLYQTYRGIDWKKMRELYDAAEEAEQLKKDWTGERSNPEYIRLNEIIEEYRNYQNLYVEDYKNLTEKDLPTYYIYEFKIMIGSHATSYDENGFAKEFQASPEKRVTESFQEINIKIAEKQYTIDVGEIRLHTEHFPSHIKLGSLREPINVKGIPINKSKGVWGDGKIQLMPMKFTAEEDLTLTKMSLFESESVALIAQVTISDARGKVIVNSNWDLESPMNIEKGQQLYIELIVQDRNAIQLEYAGRFYPLLEYTVEGETHFYMQEHVMDSIAYEYQSGFWVRYAAVFDGLAKELADYFNYCVPLNESWRDAVK